MKGINLLSCCFLPPEWPTQPSTMRPRASVDILPSALPWSMQRGHCNAGASLGNGAALGAPETSTTAFSTWGKIC